MLVVPSASDAAAVISADPPLAILSASVFASLSESVTDPTSCSSTSVIVIVIVSVSAAVPSVAETTRS